MGNIFILVALVTVAALVLNLPFGYMRAKTRKFSVSWFLYIHLPIPAIILIRKSIGVGYEAVPIIIAGAIVGQVIGARVNPKA